MNADDGGPAFPQHGFTRDPETLARMADFRGLTLRDYFAAKAMAAMISRNEDDGAYCAEVAYRFADAMLSARKVPGEKR